MLRNLVAFEEVEPPHVEARSRAAATQTSQSCKTGPHYQLVITLGIRICWQLLSPFHLFRSPYKMYWGAARKSKEFRGGKLAIIFAISPFPPPGTKCTGGAVEKIKRIQGKIEK